MMPAMRILPLLLALPALALGGCVRTVADIVTFPVKAVGQGVDWATTSQDESDRNYGRKMRKKEAEEGRRMKKEDRKRREQERERRRDWEDDRD
jgi:hypothetical protein